MITLGQDEMAKYPFIGDAGQYLRDKGFELETFGDDPDLAPIIKKAFERIRVSTEGRTHDSEMDSSFDTKLQKDSVLPTEVLSFILAIILIKSANGHSLINRFCLSEARRAHGFLLQDLNNPKATDSAENKLKETAVKIIHEISQISLTQKENSTEWLIPVADYVRRSVNFHERPWKLINQRVHRGNVIMTSGDIVRLIRTEIQNYIKSKIKSIMNTSQSLSNQYVADVEALAERFTLKIVETGEYPPCIKHAIDVLHKGENLPHSGRFLLATYLLKKGQSVEQIAPLFKNAPDYNERVTMYQLNNLAGKTGSGTEYSCPSCEKVKTNNLCFAVPECSGIINPVQFGRIRQ